MSDFDDRAGLLESEIERRLGERFAALRDEFERLRMESDRRWEGFLSRFDQDFRGIVPPELLLPPPPPPAPEMPPPPPARGVLSLDAARILDAAANQVEMLHRFLDLCREHASRAALLIAKAGGLGVWKAVGFAERGGDDDAVRRVSLPGEGEFARVLAGTPVALRGDNDVSRQLLASESVSGILIPMVVKEKISGAIYADAMAGEEARFDPDSIALLTFLAGLSVDRLASRKLKPAPPLAAPVEAEPAHPPVPEEAGTPEPSYPVAEEAPAEPPPPPPAASVEPATPAPAPAEQIAPESAREEATAPEPSASQSWKRTTPERSVAEAEAPSSAIDFEPEPPSEAAHPPDFAASVPPRTSAGARRLAGPLAPSSEGDERRDEARRFARLLVSEIKLYNERAVLEGREHGNLYARLKEDIDRSRQMYDDRIPEDIRASSNFFYEELVRVLADGRADALGM